LRRTGFPAELSDNEAQTFPACRGATKVIPCLEEAVVINKILGRLIQKVVPELLSLLPPAGWVPHGCSADVPTSRTVAA